MSEVFPKRLKRQPVRLFERNIPGIIEIILSFIEDSRSCFWFALTCKRVHYVWNSMMNKSSLMRYRYRFLNDEPRCNIMQGNAFDCLDPHRFVTSIEEYMAQIPPVLQPVIAAIAELNKDEGTAFIAGGAPVEWLLRGGYDNMSKSDLDDEALLKQSIYCNASESFETRRSSIIKSTSLRNIVKGPDIDIFIKQGAEFSTADIHKGIKTYSVPWRKQWYVNDRSAPRGYILLDLITSDPSHTHVVSDVLCMFDLICCSVAFIPHPTRPTVMWYPETIRALSSRVVHMGPFPWSAKTYFRFCKYRYRLGLHPSLSHPHDLRKYHTQCVERVPECFAPHPFIEHNSEDFGEAEYHEDIVGTEFFPVKVDSVKFGFTGADCYDSRYTYDRLDTDSRQDQS